MANGLYDWNNFNWRINDDLLNNVNTWLDNNSTTNVNNLIGDSLGLTSSNALKTIRNLTSNSGLSGYNDNINRITRGIQSMPALFSQVDALGDIDDVTKKSVKDIVSQYLIAGDNRSGLSDALQRELASRLEWQNNPWNRGMDLASKGFDIVTGLGNLALGFSNYRLGKDSLNYQKELTKKNYNQQVKALNARRDSAARVGIGMQGLAGTPEGDAILAKSREENFKPW